MQRRRFAQDCSCTTDLSRRDLVHKGDEDGISEYFLEEEEKGDEVRSYLSFCSSLFYLTTVFIMVFKFLVLMLNNNYFFFFSFSISTMNIDS